jgi:hypothetical protein
VIRALNKNLEDAFGESMHSPANVQNIKVNKAGSRRAATIVAGCFLLLTLLFVAACKDDEGDTVGNKSATPAATQDIASTPSKGLIKADPNPIPAGAGLGKTKISWNTQTDGPVTITVSTNGEPEVNFSGGEKEGAMEAPWIQAGASYDFRLYLGTGANKKLLDHVVVTRSK